MSLGIPGPSAKISTYDLFIVWHHVAMSTLTPPTQSDRNAAHRGPVFLPWHDQPPWNSASSGFRNHLEGWNPNLGLHNRVHVWVGGDMLPSTSPNDPIFFMNHCNVDRIWEAWMSKTGGPGRVYVPDDKAPNYLKGQRLKDTLTSLLSASTTLDQMLDVTSLYTYDSLVV